MLTQCYMVGPAAIIAAFEGHEFQVVPGSPGLSIGPALYEDPSLPDRRGLIAHEMTGTQMIATLEVLQARGVFGLVTLTYIWPADWRWPVSA